MRVQLRVQLLLRILLVKLQIHYPHPKVIPDDLVMASNSNKIHIAKAIQA